MIAAVERTASELGGIDILINNAGVLAIAIPHILYGLAHVKIPVPLSSLQSLFIVAVIFLSPIIAAILLWTKFDRIGSCLSHQFNG